MLLPESCALHCGTVTVILPNLSEAIAALAASAAPWLAAIRIGTSRHVTGTAWGNGPIVTTDRGLPPQDGYTLVMPGGRLATARLLHRAPALNLALLSLEEANPVPAMAGGRPPAVGSLALVAGADFDGSPTVRLTAVHRLSRATEQGAVLDMTEAQADPGALVLDPSGAVLGIAQVTSGGAVTIVPHLTVTGFMETASRAGAPASSRGAPPPSTRPRPSSGAHSDRRGWFGVALQPITVPESLVPRAGQASGRLVVGITAGGPAEQAGLRVGDVLLSLDGHSTSGANSLRTFLEGSRVGSRVEARILRETTIATAWLTVAEQP